MTITFTTTYTTITCSSEGCGVKFALDDRFIEARKRDRGTFYCPNGHTRWFPGKTAEQERDAAKARARHLEDQLQAADADAERARRELVRQQARFANGVCPQCNRSFDNVRRHMASKHHDVDTDHLYPATRFRCGCGRSFDTYRGLRTHQGHAINTASWSETAQVRARRLHTTKV